MTLNASCRQPREIDCPRTTIAARGVRCREHDVLKWVNGLNRSRGRTLRLATPRSDGRQGILTSGAISPSRAMIEDVLIRKFVAEHQPLHESPTRTRAFSRVIVRALRQLHPVQDLDASKITNAVMLLASNSKQFRLG